MTPSLETNGLAATEEAPRLPAERLAKVYTVDEAAEALQISERFIYQMIREGQIQPFRLGRLVRFSTWALEEFIRDQERIEKIEKEVRGNGVRSENADGW